MLSAVITGYALFLIGSTAFYHTRSRRQNPLDFKFLLARLFPIRPEGATFFVDPSQLREPVKMLECDRLWRAMGGRTGLQNMLLNANVLLLLAALIQQREPKLELPLIKQLRADSASLRRTAYRIYLLTMFRHASPAMVLSLNKAGATYWSMAGRVIKLYELYHAPRVRVLKTACNIMP